MIIIWPFIPVRKVILKRNRRNIIQIEIITVRSLIDVDKFDKLRRTFLCRDRKNKQNKRQFSKFSSCNEITDKMTYQFHIRHVCMFFINTLIRRLQRESMFILVLEISNC